MVTLRNWLDDLICPACTSSLKRSDNELTCRTCSENYPVLFDTPIVVRGTDVVRLHRTPSKAALEALIQGLYLPDTARDRVEECYSISFGFENKIMQTESEQFIDRLRSSGLSIPDMYPSSEQAEKVSIPVNNHDADVHLDVLTWPRDVTVGQMFSFTVILRNTGPSILSSSGDTPFRLSFRWEGFEAEGHRTDLFIDLEPGRQISMPISVHAPSLPGLRRLTVLPLVEHSHWLPDAKVSSTVNVVASHNSSLSVDWQVSHEERSYGEDHLSATKRLTQWIDDLNCTKPAKILEIGGNFNPMIQYIDRDVDFYNLDIDPFGLMTLSIRNSTDGGRVRNIVADGTSMPFPDGFFDAIVMFATFHHFPDPITFMRSVHRKLANHGFVALMCEPIGHIFAGHAPEGLTRTQEGRVRAVVRAVGVS